MVLLKHKKTATKGLGYKLTSTRKYHNDVFGHIAQDAADDAAMQAAKEALKKMLGNILAGIKL